MTLLLLLWACASSDDPSPTEATPGTDGPTSTAESGAPAPSGEGDDGGYAELTIQPYLQQVRPTEAWILWETVDGVGSRVDYGIDTLDSVACGERVPTLPGGDPDDALTQVHAPALEGISPDTVYQHQARTGDSASVVQQFRTAPLPNAEKGFHLVAMSDSQLDSRHPDVFRDVLQQGVLPVLEAEGDAAFVLFPGDLVDNAWVIEDWRDELFGPGAELWGRSPAYPTVGSHEGGSPHYFRYFHLPEEDELQEHAWHQDHSNLRVLALDSNSFREDEQLVWLDAQLADACTQAHLDFVFAQLHHPMQSELWTPGESDFTAEVVARLEAFTASCGKPSVHFFGHTHGYSRGQSPDHQHLMVNVASGGGALDRWGEQPQVDYGAFSVSEGTYGFVTMHVEAGDAPSFRLTRYDRGTPEAPLDNVVSEQITALRYNTPPTLPEPLPVGASCPATLALDGFADAEGHEHQASQWQVDSDCTFTELQVDRWRQRRNEYGGVDPQAGDDLLDEVVEVEGAARWRARVRDAHLAWSEWTEPQAATLPSCP